MQQTIPNRIVVYAKDVMNITGRKERSARQLIAKIRKKHNKAKNQFITVDEFAAYTGIPKSIVIPFLR